MYNDDLEERIEIISASIIKHHLRVQSSLVDFNTLFYFWQFYTNNVFILDRGGPKGPWMITSEAQRGKHLHWLGKKYTLMFLFSKLWSTCKSHRGHLQVALRHMQTTLQHLQITPRPLQKTLRHVQTTLRQVHKHLLNKTLA